MNMNAKTITAALALSLTVIGCTQKEMSIEQKVNELYERMTQEERIAQLRSTYLNDFFKPDGTLDTVVKLSFDIKNTGAMEGDEVAQIYLSPTSEGQNIRPIQLQGFSRVSLKPGK